MATSVRNEAQIFILKRADINIYSRTTSRRRRLFTDMYTGKTDASRLQTSYEPRVPIAIEGRSKPLLFRRGGNSIRLRSWAPRENYVKLNECNLTRDSCNAM